MTLVYSRVLSLFENLLVLNRTTIDLKARYLLGAQEQSINLRLLRKPPLRQLGFVFAHKTFIIASILRRKCRPRHPFNFESRPRVHRRNQEIERFSNECLETKTNAIIYQSQ